MEKTDAHIREIVEDDAEALLGFFKALDGETKYMLFEPGERTGSIASQREAIRNGIKHGNPTVFVAQAGEAIVGFCLASRGQFNRIKHSASLVLGVLQGYSGLGIGTRLISRLESWAKAAGVIRLELTVVAENLNALGLYRKMGFEIEGTRKGSMNIEGRYQDEFFMGKRIGSF